jgi:hypothetical protein
MSGEFGQRRARASRLRVRRSAQSVASEKFARGQRDWNSVATESFVRPGRRAQRDGRPKSCEPIIDRVLRRFARAAFRSRTLRDDGLSQRTAVMAWVIGVRTASGIAVSHEVPALIGVSTQESGLVMASMSWDCRNGIEAAVTAVVVRDSFTQVRPYACHSSFSLRFRNLPTGSWLCCAASLRIPCFHSDDDIPVNLIINPV